MPRPKWKDTFGNQPPKGTKMTGEERGLDAGKAFD